MYEHFFGFNEKPFQITPNPKYLYKSEKHEKALTYLEYGLTQNVGFILLTGEVGSGKTTLIQYMLNQLGENTVPAVIFNTNLSANELLRMVLIDFELKPTGDKAEDLQTLNQFLIGVYGLGKQALLIIDEAQNLESDTIEEIRMLSNLQTESHNLLQIMLVGQPELNAKLKHPSMLQVTQRIAVRYHLTGLNRKDTGHYIAYRLKHAGGKASIFSEAAVDLIFKISGGIPRSINTACEASLVYAYADGVQMISQDIVKQIIDDNLGIGVAPAGQAQDAEPLSHSGDSHPDPSNNGYKERLDSIEQIVKSLQGTVENRLGVIEKGLSSQQNEAIQKLTQLLQYERERNQNLLRKNVKLEMMYLHLKQIIEKAREKVQKMRAAKV